MSCKRLLRRLQGLIRLIRYHAIFKLHGVMGTILPIIIMENEQIDSQVSKRLSTFLPVDVFYGLTEFCKANAKTGLDKWDYGVGIRILLMKAQYADMIYAMDMRLNELEEKIESKSQSKESEIPKGFYEAKTLGKLNMENKNG